MSLVAVTDRSPGRRAAAARAIAAPNRRATLAIVDALRTAGTDVVVLKAVATQHRTEIEVDGGRVPVPPPRRWPCT